VAFTDINSEDSPFEQPAILTRVPAAAGLPRLL